MAANSLRAREEEEGESLFPFCCAMEQPPAPGLLTLPQSIVLPGEARKVEWVPLPMVLVGGEVEGLWVGSWQWGLTFGTWFWGDGCKQCWCLALRSGL